MVKRIDKGDTVVFEMNGEKVILYKRGRFFGNVEYQAGNGSKIVGHLHNIDFWLEKGSMTVDEFIELRSLVEENVVLVL